MTDFPTDTPRTLSRRRVLEAVPATALAAGTYVYRVVARMASGALEVATGMMTILK